MDDTSTTVTISIAVRDTVPAGTVEMCQSVYTQQTAPCTDFDNYCGGTIPSGVLGGLDCTPNDVNPNGHVVQPIPVPGQTTTVPHVAVLPKTGMSQTAIAGDIGIASILLIAGIGLTKVRRRA